ncbi:hypothetical protein [Dactylosporangium roseum]
MDDDEIPDFWQALGVLARQNLGDDWLRAVCWNNAAALFLRA